MGLKQTHKQEFDLKLTNTIEQKKQLMQVGYKWSSGLNKDNFKLKLYMACNIWEEAPLPYLKYML
jgi:hypothetical protein